MKSRRSSSRIAPDNRSGSGQTGTRAADNGAEAPRSTTKKDLESTASKEEVGKGFEDKPPCAFATLKYTIGKGKGLKEFKCTPKVDFNIEEYCVHTSTHVPRSRFDLNGRPDSRPGPRAPVGSSEACRGDPTGEPEAELDMESGLDNDSLQDSRCADAAAMGRIAVLEAKVEALERTTQTDALDVWFSESLQNPHCATVGLQADAARDVPALACEW